MPNTFAYLVLLTWPLVCLILLLRFPFERALVWCFLGGYLLLPPLAAFDLPVLPALDKFTLPSLSALILCLLVLRRPVTIWPDSRLGRVLMALFILGVIPTVLTNGDAIPFAAFAPDAASRAAAVAGELPGMSAREMVSNALSQMVVLIPFVMARQFLSSPTGLREILLALVVGALIYSIPALIEIRLSPQINTWVYGFFQHDFIQMIRKGGFRPIVFLPHALWLSFFILTAILSASALARYAPQQDRMRWLLAVNYLLGVLYLSKSLGAWVFAIALTPLVLVSSARLQLWVAVVFALIAVIYPMLRILDLVPLEAILTQAETIDPARAGSLAYRFINEALLLERAQDRAMFGWGGWGRNLLHDPWTGAIATIPDGRWIILFGSAGWLGYIAEMGLLALPLALLLQAQRRVGTALSPYAVTLAVILAATLMDMLVNATLTPFTWLCAGAILGYAEAPKGHESTPQLRKTFKTNPIMRGENRQVSKPEM